MFKNMRLKEHYCSITIMGVRVEFGGDAVLGTGVTADLPSLCPTTLTSIGHLLLVFGSWVLTTQLLTPKVK